MVDERMGWLRKRNQPVLFICQLPRDLRVLS